MERTRPVLIQVDGHRVLHVGERRRHGVLGCRRAKRTARRVFALVPNDAVVVPQVGHEHVHVPVAVDVRGEDGHGVVDSGRGKRHSRRVAGGFGPGVGVRPLVQVKVHAVPLRRRQHVDLRVAVDVGSVHHHRRGHVAPGGNLMHHARGVGEGRRPAVVLVPARRASPRTGRGRGRRGRRWGEGECRAGGCHWMKLPPDEVPCDRRRSTSPSPSTSAA